jgi:hypothetical protein
VQVPGFQVHPGWLEHELDDVSDAHGARVPVHGVPQEQPALLQRLDDV